MTNGGVVLVDIGPLLDALHMSAVLFGAAAALAAAIGIAEHCTSRRRTVPDDPRRLVAGHVPGMRARSTLNRAERRIAAADLVDLLASDGLWCERKDRSTVVRAHGPAGEYVVHVRASEVGVAHSGPGGTVHLGQYPSTYVAALALAAHAAAA